MKRYLSTEQETVRNSIYIYILINVKKVSSNFCICLVNWFKLTGHYINQLSQCYGYWIASLYRLVVSNFLFPSYFIYLEMMSLENVQRRWHAINMNPAYWAKGYCQGKIKAFGEKTVAVPILFVLVREHSDSNESNMVRPHFASLS
jgi:hypothetical protein